MCYFVFHEMKCMPNALINRLQNERKDDKRSNMNMNNSQLTPLFNMTDNLIKEMQYSSGIITYINMKIPYNLFSP